MEDQKQGGAAGAVQTIDHLATVVGTLIPTVAAIGGAVRLLLTAVRPTDAQKAQAYDEASAALKKAITEGSGALLAFEEAKKQAAAAQAPVGNAVSAMGVKTTPSNS